MFEIDELALREAGFIRIMFLQVTCILSVRGVGVRCFAGYFCSVRVVFV